MKATQPRSRTRARALKSLVVAGVALAAVLAEWVDGSARPDWGIAKAHAESRVPCAGDGPPIFAGGGALDAGHAPPSLGVAEATALVTLRAVPWASGSPTIAGGDAVSGSGVSLGLARFGLCGQGMSIAYRIVYEPWSETERARPDAAVWGRLSDAQVAWVPRSWASVSIGIGKVGFGRGRDQPVGALPLPMLARAVDSLSPDRRLGLAADVDLGVARIAAGVYQGAHHLSIDALGGALFAARLVVEPIGPVGRRAFPDGPSRLGPRRPRGSAATSTGVGVATDTGNDSRPFDTATDVQRWLDRPRLALGLSAAYRIVSLGTPSTDAQSGPGAASGYALGGDFALSWKRLLLDGEFVYAVHWPLERAGLSGLGSALAGTRLGGWLEEVLLLYRRSLATSTVDLGLALRQEYLDEGSAPGSHGRLIITTVGLTARLLERFQLQAAYTRTFPLGGIPNQPPGNDAVVVDLMYSQ